MATTSIFETAGDGRVVVGASLSFCNDRCRVLVHGWAVFIIMCQSTEVFVRISFPGLLRRFALEIWCILPFDPVSGSLSSVSVCCLWNTVTGFFRR